MGCHALLQGIFLTQGSNQRLLSLLLWQAGFSTAITTWEPINVYIICHFLETFIERSKSFPSLPYPLNSLQPTHELSSQMLIPSLGGELPIFSSHHHSCFKMQRIYPLSKTITAHLIQRGREMEGILKELTSLFMPAAGMVDFFSPHHGTT